jgi:hypothetical protein
LGKELNISGREGCDCLIDDDVVILEDINELI